MRCAPVEMTEFVVGRIQFRACGLKLFLNSHRTFYGWFLRPIARRRIGLRRTKLT